MPLSTSGFAHPELDTDPMSGLSGYRVTTALRAGACDGTRRDDCLPGDHRVCIKNAANGGCHADRCEAC